MGKPITRIVEINVHRSKRNPRLGHAVAVLFPCSHHRYLGLTLFKGGEDTDSYRANDIKIVRLDDYSVMDKDTCKLCPYEAEFLTDDFSADITLDDLADVLQAVDDDL